LSLGEAVNAGCIRWHLWRHCVMVGLQRSEVSVAWEVSDVGEGPKCSAGLKYPFHWVLGSLVCPSLVPCAWRSYLPTGEPLVVQVGWD
jgi:hypothetical protein